MTLNALLAFMVISQIAVSAYLLYSFNTIERASRQRHQALAERMDDAFAGLEARLTGVARPRARLSATETSVPGGGQADLLQPRQA